jgi:Domain of unknown function (DUF932)
MTIYTATARFDGSARALTEAELFKAAPSIFATEAHASRSDRFRPIPTIEMIKALATEGFSVVGAMQSAARSEDRKGFTKHLLRIRRLDDQAKYTVGGSTVEILLRNANDGSSAYEITSGVFRIACLNSLVAKLSNIDEVKVRHSGDAVNKVIEGTYSVIQNADMVMDNIERWQGLQLNVREQRALALGARVERFGDAEGNVHTGITPEQLLTPRRLEDRRDDLWTVGNRIQEACIRGGLRSVSYDENGRRRRSTSREVKGIDQGLKFNKALWTMMDYLGQNCEAAH